MKPFDTYETFRNTNTTGGAVDTLYKVLLEGETLNEFGWGARARDAYLDDESLSLELGQ
jgi:hypothetical protein